MSKETESGCYYCAHRDPMECSNRVQRMLLGNTGAGCYEPMLIYNEEVYEPKEN